MAGTAGQWPGTNLMLWLAWLAPQVYDETACACNCVVEPDTKFFKKPSNEAKCLLECKPCIPSEEYRFIDAKKAANPTSGQSHVPIGTKGLLHAF